MRIVSFNQRVLLDRGMQIVNQITVEVDGKEHVVDIDEGSLLALNAVYATSKEAQSVRFERAAASAPAPRSAPPPRRAPPPPPAFENPSIGEIDQEGDYAEQMQEDPGEVRSVTFTPKFISDEDGEQV